MEIFDSKIKKLIIYISFFFLVIAIFSVGFYFWNFSATISNSQAQWGMFGDYIGGVAGTIFNLMAVTFSLLALYITAKISIQVHTTEINLQKENLKLFRLQNKPVPYLNLVKYPEKLKIEIMNNGTGTLTITSWKILRNGKEYRHFNHLLEENSILQYTTDKTLVYFNSSPVHVLAPGTSKTFLKIKPKDEINSQFSAVYSEAISLLKDSKIIIYYEDIFGEEFTYGDIDLIFFGE